ncbi:MAG: hypothetical protein ACR2NW_04145 [Thermodesulfobacteriota bacterium]
MAANIRIIREIFTIFTCESCKRKNKQGLYIGLQSKENDKKYYFCKICYEKIIEKFRERHGGICSIDT